MIITRKQFFQAVVGAFTGLLVRQPQITTLGLHEKPYALTFRREMKRWSATLPDLFETSDGIVALIKKETAI